eukprot:COSAG01_NODE_23115_length_828_cov_0.533608_2_plen_119_part_00
MEIQTSIILILLVTLVAVFFPSYILAPLLRRRAERAVVQIEDLHRYARRHNTFVRTLNGRRYVVSLGSQGLHYVLENQFVSRERLLRALGEGSEASLRKAEEEESRHGPTPTFTTAAA